MATLLALPQSASATSLLLDGDDDYVEAGLDPTAANTTTARTWEAWIKTTSDGGDDDWETILGRHRNLPGQESWALSLVDGTPAIWIGTGIDDGHIYGSRKGSVAVNDGAWHHIAAVWVPSTRLDVYVDGQLANGTLSGAILASLPTASTTSIRIGVGANLGNLYGTFEGAIDGVRYSLEDRYSGNFTPDPHPTADYTTIALWSFDEGAGTTTATQGLSNAAATLLYGARWTFGPSPAS